MSMDEDLYECARRKCRHIYQHKESVMVRQPSPPGPKTLPSWKGTCPKCGHEAFYLVKPLFIPLKAEHYDAFAAAEAAQKTATLTAPKKKAKRAQPALAEPVIELNLGLDLFGRPAVPAATERNLPSGARDTLGGVGYALQLVRELLNESGGALAWPRLVDAFTLATQPALMAQLTKSADAARVEAWTKRWNESLPPGSLLTAIEQLGSNNLVAERADGICTIRLKDGPKATASKHANYDAWLALSVLGPAPALRSDGLHREPGRHGGPR